ncbi:MAG TPA: hypothetical protein VGK13_06350, partial [Methanocellaceae archaeon]
KVMFSRGLPLTLLVSQPLDNTVSSEPIEERVSLSRRMIKESFVKLTPAKYGDITLGPLKLSAVSLLYRDTLYLGNEETLRVRPDIGQASTGLDEIVIEYGHRQGVPTFFLVDTDPSMGAGDGPSSLDLAIDLGARLAAGMYADDESPGLLCFSRPGIVRLVAAGELDAEAFQGALANLKPDRDQTTGNRPASRSLQDLYEEGVMFDNAAGHAALQPIFEKTLAEYAANIEDDGFSRAISQVIQATAAPCNIIVVTNLSMGLASLLNGIRLASFHACSPSVILMPRLWPEDDELMDKEKRYHEHAEIEEALVKLRAGSIKVHKYSPEAD